MHRSRRSVCCIAACAVLAAAVLSCDRQEGRDAEAPRHRVSAPAVSGRRAADVEARSIAARRDPELERELAKIRKLYRSHRGLCLGLVAFCALAALVALVRALRGGQATAYLAAGTALASEGKHEEACEMFAKALKIQPRSFQATVKSALSLAELGRYREACEKLDQVLEFEFSQDAWVGRAGVTARAQGIVWEEKAACQEACTEHARAVEANPQDARAYLRWGIALGKLGRHAEACEKYAKAVEVNPQDPEVYTHWGVALAELGSHAEAHEKFARAVETGPRYADAYFHWGVALARAGQRAEADEKLHRAVALYPKLRPQVEEMRKQLLGKE